MRVVCVVYMHMCGVGVGVFQAGDERPSLLEGAILSLSEDVERAVAGKFYFDKFEFEQQMHERKH